MATQTLCGLTAGHQQVTGLSQTCAATRDNKSERKRKRNVGHQKCSRNQDNSMSKSKESSGHSDSSNTGDKLGTSSSESEKKSIGGNVAKNSITLKKDDQRLNEEYEREKLRREVANVSPGLWMYWMKSWRSFMPHC